MATVAVVVHHDRPAATAAAHDLTAWLVAQGHQVRIPATDEAAGMASHLVPSSELGVGADVAVSLGGDGTMLRTIAPSPREACL
jgi:NAD+ kinase